MKKVLYITNPTLCLLLLLQSCNAHTQSLSVEHTAEGMLVKQGEEKVLFYQRETKSKDGKCPRANYVHPLYGIDGLNSRKTFLQTTCTTGASFGPGTK